MIITDYLKAVVRVAWPKANEGRGLKPIFLVKTEILKGQWANDLIFPSL
ncbi:MAG: hypothetical protein F6K46_36865 [Moorea sp. SIO3E8]|nr:hypothetical protein [Moorena sp. SIO3E8]